MSGPTRIVIPAEATMHLAAVDPVMAEIIDRIGPLDYGVDKDVWRSLVGSIVGQQLSVKAARTIRARVAGLGSNGFPTPSEILACSDDALRGCGLSRAKTGYVRDLAIRWHEGEIDGASLIGLGDEEVVERLIRVRGVGRWTAEMVLIFSLARPDVLAVDDLGIRVAAQRAYGLEDRPGKSELSRIGAPWKPFRSYASLYLWRSLES